MDLHLFFLCIDSFWSVLSFFSCAFDDLRTFARNFSNIDFFLRILPLKDDELAMSEM